MQTGFLWNAMVRRVRQLGAAYGQGAAELPFEPPFRLEQSHTRVVRVERHSARQGRAMTWPGLMGELELRVHTEQALVAEMLTLLQQVQLGKATSFGFGALQVQSLKS